MDSKNSRKFKNKKYFYKDVFFSLISALRKSSETSPSWHVTSDTHSRPCETHARSVMAIATVLIEWHNSINSRQYAERDCVYTYISDDLFDTWPWTQLDDASWKLLHVATRPLSNTYRSWLNANSKTGVRIDDTIQSATQRIEYPSLS